MRHESYSGVNFPVRTVISEGIAVEVLKDFADCREWNKFGAWVKNEKYPSVARQRVDKIEKPSSFTEAIALRQ